MVSYAIITQLRRTAIAISIASALLLAAAFATRVSPAGRLAPRELAGATDWNGWIAGVPDGTYTFTIPGGGAAQLAIDGRIVADGRTSTAIRLDAAPHAFDLQTRPQAQAPGPQPSDVTWSRDGSAASPVPASMLFARKPRPLTLAILAMLHGALVASEWLWVVVLAASAFALAIAGWRAIRPSIAADTDWPWLRWIVVGSAALNAIPIWWGLPSIWPPDELTPGTVLRALDAHFANGWFDRWPPLHYYVVTAAFSPLLLLNAFGRIDFSSAVWLPVLILVERSVSVAAAAGTVIATAVVASRVFGRRAGVWAAAIFALAVPFPYYAKTGNLDVPYVFWFAVSLVFYFRLLETPAVRTAVGFAAFATFAICTKDQAYALYPLMALSIAFRAWRLRRMAPLAAGAAAACVIFAACHNLLFNWNGFVEHVRYIAGPGSENYRVFPATFSGRLALARLTAVLIKDSWGWPITIACAAGLVLALAVKRCAAGFALIAPAVSYYVGFVNVILYNYDRFVLPITLVLSIFGGFAIDRLLSSGLRVRWARITAVAMVFAYTILYAATIDALMLRDSRYVVARWVAGHVQPGEEVAVSGPREILPTFTMQVADVATLEQLDRVRPAYYVLSADYGRAVPLDNYWGQVIAALQNGSAGYTLVARVRCPSPWPWLPDAHPELVGPRPIAPGGDATSVLRDINPTIEIYARGAVSAAALGCR